MKSNVLKIINVDSIADLRRESGVAAETLQQAAQIIEQVRSGGEPSLRMLVSHWDQRKPNDPLIYDRAACERELDALDRETRELLERVAQRIRAFAQAQLGLIQPMELALYGGMAGQTWHPLSAAGCYVPGGRYPLVSSLLMTAVTARVAGVPQIWVSSPAATNLMLAAAAIAGANGFLAAGGAHAIAALAYGIGGAPKCDVIVGPGNRWVTAAKQLVSVDARIDMLAGPSELLVVADDSANPATVAADLLAQAEHDVDARPMLLAFSETMVASVNRELERQLKLLTTDAVARQSLRHGFALVARDWDQALSFCQEIAPEHLELHLADPQLLAPHLTRCGCLFIGGNSAEVFGDYGAGPNHVLPTGGTARYASGLSVETFLRRQTWLRIDDLSTAQPMIADTIQLALLEGLPAHAESARRRKSQKP